MKYVCVIRTDVLVLEEIMTSLHMSVCLSIYRDFSANSHRPTIIVTHAPLNNMSSRGDSSHE